MEKEPESHGLGTPAVAQEAPAMPDPVPGTAIRPMTYATQAAATPSALVVYCLDPRFAGPTREFLDKELGLKEGSYVSLQIPGGAASATLLELPKEAKYVRDQIAFALKQFRSIERVILVSHEDCGKYKELQRAMPHLLSFVRSVTERQHLDLQKVAEMLAQLAPHHVEVERYYAKFANSEHTAITFEKQ